MKDNTNESNNSIYRLTPDAAQQLTSKIDVGKLDGFLGLSPRDCLLDIALAAKESLEAQGKSSRGCNSERDVKSWLGDNRVRKTKPVFMALCSVVGIDWCESCEPNASHEEIKEAVLRKDRKTSIRDLIDSLVDRFASSEEEKDAIKFKYASLIKELVAGNRINTEGITDLIELIRKDFATNGRQIRLKIEDPNKDKSKSYKFTSVEISGLNQNRELSTWVRRYDVPFPLDVETNMWWWQESISIKFEATNGERSITHSGSVTVPPRGFVMAYVSFWLETREFTVDESSPLKVFIQS
jgi:hypothetical protein